jgi:hypothetical protein
MTGSLEKAIQGTFSLVACWYHMMSMDFPNFRGGKKRCIGLALSVVLPALICAVSTPASATMLQRQSLSDLAKKAEFIFEGQPVGRAVETLPDGQGARTCYVFNIIQAIAGSHPGSTVRLCFLGGMIGNKGFAVSDLNMPAIGEHGIYLVESTGQAMVNPLIGWDQGHFLVAKDKAGAFRITTADHRRVTGLTPDAAKPTAAVPEITSPSGAAAVGVLADAQADLSGAMPRDAFINELRAFHDR